MRIESTNGVGGLLSCDIWGVFDLMLEMELECLSLDYLLYCTFGMVRFFFISSHFFPIILAIIIVWRW